MAAARAAAAAEVTLMAAIAMEAAAAEDTAAAVEVEDTVVVEVVVTAAGTFFLSFSPSLSNFVRQLSICTVPFQPTTQALSHTPDCSSLRCRTNTPD